MTLPPVVLVTGTDTGVGKTVVTAALVALLTSRGRSVAVLKPAQTGVTADEPGDIDEVRRLTGHTDLFEGARLRDPLAPTTAARREGVVLPSVADHALRVGQLLASGFDHVVVEGAGGLLVGLDSDGADLTDLARALVAPYGFVVVARSGLGTLNHSALTVEALRARNLPLLGLVIGAVPAEPDLAESCNVDDLPAVTGAAVLGGVPAGAGELSCADFRSHAPTWFAGL